MVGRRLRRNEMMGKTISIYLRDATRNGYHERSTIYTYTDSSHKIFKAAERVIDEMNWRRVLVPELRLVGVSISNLLPKAITPLPLLLEDQRLERIINASDMVNDKFGEFTLIPANTLIADRTKGKISSFLKH